MNCTYVGRRYADPGCEVMRVDTSRIGRLLIDHPEIPGADRFVRVPLGLIWPDLPPFDWGRSNQHSEALACAILQDAFPDWCVSRQAVIAFLGQVVEQLPPDGFDLPWSEVFRWYMDYVHGSPATAEHELPAPWEVE